MDQVAELALSVVLAAYNEEPVLANNLHRIVSELLTRPQVSWELVLVDDGSSDHTGQIMEELEVQKSRVKIFHHRRNFGQGRALRTGFDACRGKVVITLDADLSYGPEYIYRLFDALEANQADIALASAYTRGGSVNNVPTYRHFLSRVGNYYLARMSNYNISTSTCVVRAYRRDVLDSLVLTSDGMELQLEVLMKAWMLGFKVCEVPAHLEWTSVKAAQADIRRVSKMRIIRTIRMYLLLGWLTKPAGIFIVLALMLLLPGVYMGLIFMAGAVANILALIPEGITVAISRGLEETFQHRTYALAFSGGFIVVGLQLLGVALKMLQSKFYFEELFLILQRIDRHDHSNTINNQ
jgi:dolichol-phosphate mannosyltransferase